MTASSAASKSTHTEVSPGHTAASTLAGASLRSGTAPRHGGGQLRLFPTLSTVAGTPRRPVDRATLLDVVEKALEIIDEDLFDDGRIFNNNSVNLSPGYHREGHPRQ